METSFPRVIQVSEHNNLTITQLYVGDVGCVVWDAALVLGSFLMDSGHFPPDALQGKSVIELGAGTGAVGLIACTLGADVIITDLYSCLSLMKKNIDDNKGILRGNIQAKTLEWGQPLTGFEAPNYILIADVVYYEEALDKLVETIQGLTGVDTIVYMCYEVRTTGNKPQLEKRFFELMSHNFESSEIPFSDLPEHCRSEDIKLFKFLPINLK